MSQQNKVGLNNTMKTLTQLIVGISSLAAVAVSHTRMVPSNLPTELTTTGISGTVTSSGETKDLNGPWYQTSTWDYGPHYRGGYYTNALGYNMSVTIANDRMDYGFNSELMQDLPPIVIHGE